MASRLNPPFLEKLAASQWKPNTIGFDRPSNGRGERASNDAPEEGSADENRGRDVRVSPGGATGESPANDSAHDPKGFREGTLQVRLEGFGEKDLCASVQRELSWLLNTTNFESTTNLTAFPNVKTSVLNYGVADLAGKAQSRSAIVARAGRIKEALTAFEPRLDPKQLVVEPRSTSERENAVTYQITASITAAVEALRVRYLTDVETDTGATTVRE